MIDDRAGSERLIRYPCLSAVAQLTRLDAGDVAIVGNGPDDEPVMVGVEVKSILDLIASMNTGRLQATQLPAMLEHYQVRWLAYYGQYRPGRNGQLEVRRGQAWRKWSIGNRPTPYGYIESMLFDVVAIGVNVRHCYDEAETAAWIACLHRWFSKPWSKHRGLHVFDRSRRLMEMPGLDGDVHLRASIAKELPGLGYQRAVAAARHFTSVNAMLTADVREWCEVDGVGKVLAKAIVEVLR